MNCDEVEELLGAFALDALPAGEAAAVRSHLAGCDEHARAAAVLRATASRLTDTVTAREPPRRLRASILDAIAAEAAAGPRAPRRSETARARTTWRPASVVALRPRTWMAIAALLVLAIAGLAAWNVALLSGGDDDFGKLAARATSVTQARGAGGAGGIVLYFDDDRRAVVFVDGLDRLDASKTYELWSIDGGKPERIGLMNTAADRTGRVVVPFDGSRARTLALTVEPAGGSDQPTSDPVLVATCIAAPPGCPNPL